MKISLTSILFEEPEQGPDALFGKYMFDDQRKDIKKSEKEQPTTEEENALSALARYVGFNDKSDLDDVAPILLGLKQKNMYAPLLDPLKGGRTNVYRILFLTTETAKSVFDIDVSKRNGTLPAGTLNPSGASQVQGWTTDPSMFYTILRNEKYKPVYVILKASLKKNNNFFGNPKRLAGTVDDDFKHERETLALGAVEYDKGIYFVSEPTQDSSEELNRKLSFAVAAIK